MPENRLIQTEIQSKQYDRAVVAFRAEISEITEKLRQIKSAEQIEFDKLSEDIRESDEGISTEGFIESLDELIEDLNNEHETVGVDFDNALNS